MSIPLPTVKTGDHLRLQPLSLLWYYLSYGFLITIAYLCNKSFILLHPNKTLPTNVTSPRNRTIHSYFPEGEVEEFLDKHYPLPQSRYWISSSKYNERVQGQNLPPYSPAIVLDGPLSGPRLRQGAIIIQKHTLLYIQNEWGRCPSRIDYITTEAVNLHSGNIFQLHIPLRLMDRHRLYDESPWSPFNCPLPLNEIPPKFKPSLHSSQSESSV